MPVLNCWVSEETMAALRAESDRRGLDPKDGPIFLAESAVAEAASTVKAIPRDLPRPKARSR